MHFGNKCFLFYSIARARLRSRPEEMFRELLMDLVDTGGKAETSMRRRTQFLCHTCGHLRRSDNIKRHMKVHDKVKVKTNEEMFRELVMDLVDNVLEKTYEQTNINEDLSEERHGSKMNSWSF